MGVAKPLFYSLDSVDGLSMPQEILDVFRTAGEVMVCPIEGQINSKMASKIKKELRELGPNTELLLAIDSGGGHIVSANQIAAMVGAFSNRHVGALVTGVCNSAALDIYLSIPKARRFALPGTWFMFHSHGSHFKVDGQFDLESMTFDGMTEEMIREKLRLFFYESAEEEKERMRIFAPYITRLTEEDSSTFMRLNHSFSAVTAKKIGVVGTIVNLLAE
jgi:ATP-dependent protease ClpP protease subunit